MVVAAALAFVAGYETSFVANVAVFPSAFVVFGAREIDRPISKMPVLPRMNFSNNPQVASPSLSEKFCYSPAHVIFPLPYEST